MADVKFFDPKTEKQVKQRRALAASLFKSSEQPTSSEVVSGHVVAQSPLLGFAKMLGSGLAGYSANKADEQETADKERTGKALADAIKMYGQDPSGAANMLMQSPATSDLGTKIQFDELGRQRTLEDFAASEAGKDRRAQIAANQKEADWQRNADLQRELIQQKATGVISPNGGNPPTADYNNLPAPTNIPTPNLTGNPIVDNALLKAFGKESGVQQGKAPAQEKGREDLGKILDSLDARLAKFNEIGASSDKGMAQALANTKGELFGFDTPLGGQDLIRLTGGSPEQTQRDLIQSDINDIKLAYQKASGLSSKNLDSNQEMKQFMTGLPSLDRSAEANAERSKDIRARFATSVAKAAAEEAAKTSGVQPNNGFLTLPNDPSAAIDVPLPPVQNDPEYQEYLNLKARRGRNG